MKKVNFDALRQIKAPEELIHRTLQAAQEQDDEQTPVAAFAPRLRRRLAVAASVVLVLGASVLVYFSIRNINNSTPLVAPAVRGTEAPSEADTLLTGETVPQTVPGVTEPASVQPTEGTVSPTAPSAPNRTDAPTAPSGSDPTAPTSAPRTEPLTQPATAPTEPTQPNPTTDAPTVPIEPPTVPIEPPTVPSEPSVNPTEPPEPGVDPPDHNGEPDNPTEVEWHPIRVHASFSPDLLTGSGRVYCSIYNSQGMSMLPWDRFSSLREARITVRDENYAWAVYEIPYIVTINTDTYLVAFYNEDGVVVSSSKKTIKGY